MERKCDYGQSCTSKSKMLKTFDRDVDLKERYCFREVADGNFFYLYMQVFSNRFARMI